jgi:hypothetical protein
MRKLMFLIVLSIIAAGQIKADPLCPTATVAFYETSFTSHANACSIGGLDFWAFNGPNAGTSASGPGSTPFNPTQIEITPVSGGITITPLNVNGFQATATGVEDVEVPFEVACDDGTNCLGSIFMSISGSATASNVGGGTNGLAALTETYCMGGALPPPGEPCRGSGVPQDSLNIGPSGPGTVTKTDMFSAVSQISMNKDLIAMGNNGSATLTSVTDLFSGPGGVPLSVPAPTPEPSTMLLLGSGLAGLAFVFKWRRRSLV